MINPELQWGRKSRIAALLFALLCLGVAVGASSGDPAPPTDPQLPLPQVKAEPIKQEPKKTPAPLPPKTQSPQVPAITLTAGSLPLPPAQEAKTAQPQPASPPVEPVIPDPAPLPTTAIDPPKQQKPEPAIPLAVPPQVPPVPMPKTYENSEDLYRIPQPPVAKNQQPEAKPDNREVPTITDVKPLSPKHEPVPVPPVPAPGSDIEPVVPAPSKDLDPPVPAPSKDLQPRAQLQGKDLDPMPQAPPVPAPKKVVEPAIEPVPPAPVPPSSKNSNVQERTRKQNTQTEREDKADVKATITAPPAFRIVDPASVPMPRSSTRTHERDLRTGLEQTATKPGSPPTSAGPTGTDRLAYPAVFLETKRMPAAKVGDIIDYHVIARNLGKAPAEQVIIEAVLPPELRMVSTTPPSKLQGDRLTWAVDRIAPGGEQVFILRAQALRAGAFEIRCATSMRYDQATKLEVQGPSLSVDADIPPDLLVGQKRPIKIAVKNESAKELSGMILQVRLHPGLRHAKGDRIETDLGVIAPNGKKELYLELEPVQAGMMDFSAVVLAGQRELAMQNFTVKVAASAQLQLKKRGPELLLQGKVVEYRIEVQNQSNNPANSVVVFDRLPEGLEFVAASNKGTYDARTRTVQWFIPQVTSGQTRAIALRVRASSTGVVRNEVTAHAVDAPQVALTADLVLEGPPPQSQNTDVSLIGFFRQFQRR